VSRRLYLAACCALLAIATIRMAYTWRTLSQTVDEAYHVACGVQWWAEKKYDREYQHPPLARILIGALPYAAGARPAGLVDNLQEGNAILGAGERYWRMLTLARAGTLPFFWLLCASLAAWAASLWGRAAGLGAMFTSTMLPSLLGHGALATTDFAPAAGLAFLGWRAHRWLREPSWPNALWTGLGLGIALATKMSALVLAPLLLAAVCLLERRRPRFAQLAAVGVLALLTLLATYRFKKEYDWQRDEGHRSLIVRAAGLRAFLVPYLRGVNEVREHNEAGHPSFLLGRYIDRGDWRFFPVALAVKMPLAVWALLLAGLFFPPARYGLWLFAAMLLPVLPAQINLGLRHALPVYIGIVLAAGFTLTRLPRVAAAAIAFWLASTSMAAHPDYIANFNLLAGGRPEAVLAESDLDWGQDFHRLPAEMNRRRIKTCRLAYFGGADHRVHAPGVFTEFPWETPQQGCVAVSVRMLSLHAAHARARGVEPPFEWLEKTGIQPIPIGVSIRLYLLPPTATDPPPPPGPAPAAGR
jgi:hypothetical protein